MTLEPANCICNDNEDWSSSYLVDRLKQHLSLVELTNSKVNTDLLSKWCGCKGNHPWPDIIEPRIYYHQAHHYFKIGAFKNPPPFQVSVSDLSSKLVKELAQLDKKDRDFALKQAVSRIFEDINAKLYHDSISVVLRVRLVE